MAPTPWTPNQYPQARRSDHVDVYKSASKGEVRVADPYNWLEEYGEDTERWINEQEAFTRKYLDQNQDRVKLEKEIRANNDYAKFSAPSLKKDGLWYWSYNSGLQAQSVIYRSTTGELPDFSKEEGAGGEVFFDPNVLSDDGTAALATTAFSRDGSHFAYGISRSGSDFSTIYIRSTKSPLTSRDADDKLKDEIRFVKFSSIVWNHESDGFFYQRMPARESHGDAEDDKAGTETDGDVDAMVYFHKLGTPQSEDVLVMKDEVNRTYMWSAEVTLDGKYLLLYTSKDTSRTNMLWITELAGQTIGPDLKWAKVINDFEAEWSLLGNDGSKFIFRTNKDAPQYCIVSGDIAAEKPTFTTVVPEDKHAFLDDATLVNEDIIAIVYKRDVKDEIYLYSLTGERLKRLAPGFVGTAEVGCRRDQSHVFVTMTGFTTPGVVAWYDFKKEEDKRWEVVRTTKVSGLVPEDFKSEQVWYESVDGTKVPMFIVHHKSTPLDGTAPAIQYGYGGFLIPINPFFSPAILTFLQKYRAVLAVPNIRGGGEFGEDWHKGGMLDKKTNVFDDFIAASQYLVEHKYAGPGKVAINGGSNGGLLVAACVNRAPEGTFGAAVAEVGVLDMLKFHRFTIGRAWTADYGDPDDPNDFDYIIPYSPIHNVPTDRVLPPTLLMTADHDDRVVPLHSFKHAATLQHTRADNPHPLLIRIDKKAGHGAGKSTEKRIQDSADKWGFVAQSLGLEWYDQ